MDRENILLVTDEGWVQNEHNKKIASDGAIIAYELGWIMYRRLPDQHCEVAIELFSANRADPLALALSQRLEYVISK